LHPPSDPAALRRSKTRFCSYVQGNRVAFREDFVRELSMYKRVDCAGPSLNNTGFVADRKRKYQLYRESKFAVTFENEAALGYTSEKLPDALLSGCVPIYWGDPSVQLDFDPRCFVHRRDHPTLASLVKRIAALDPRRRGLRGDARRAAHRGRPRRRRHGPAYTAHVLRARVRRRALREPHSCSVSSIESSSSSGWSSCRLASA
jgi:hypothetical protein